MDVFEAWGQVAAWTVCAGSVWLFAAEVSGRRHLDRPGLWMIAVGSWNCCAWSVVAGSWWAAGVTGTWGTLAWIALRRRPPRNRRRVARELGAKARARLAALVEALRRQPVPDPA